MRNRATNASEIEDTDIEPDKEFEDFDGAGNESEDSLLRKRIITILIIYPRISPSMLQVAIGPIVKPGVWRPILEDLIRIGTIDRLQESRQSERGRWKTIIILQLSETAKSIIDSDNNDDNNDDPELEPGDRRISVL